MCDCITQVFPHTLYPKAFLTFLNIEAFIVLFSTVGLLWVWCHVWLYYRCFPTLFPKAFLTFLNRFNRLLFCSAHCRITKFEYDVMCDCITRVMYLAGCPCVHRASIMMLAGMFDMNERTHLRREEEAVANWSKSDHIHTTFDSNRCYFIRTADLPMNP